MLFSFVTVLLVDEVFVCFFLDVVNVVFLARVFKVVDFFLSVDVVLSVVFALLVFKLLGLVIVETSIELSMATASTELDDVGVVKGEDDEEATRIFALSADVCVVAC